MKTLNYMVAIAAASTLYLASCNNKSKVAPVKDLDDIIEANTVTVTKNALTDTLLTIGGSEMAFAQVSRIFQVDSTGQFYMSVRAIVPADSSAMTNDLYESIVGYYRQLGDTAASMPASVANPVSLADAVDDMGRMFKAYAEPYANDTVTPGFMMNVDMRPVYGTGKYITYAVYCDYYTGGAHGEVDTYFVTYDMADGKPYTFDSLFKASSRDAVREKLVDIIAREREMSVDDYLKSLNEFLMPATPVTVKNFPVYHVGIISMGVVFSYPKYSIAAGFEGCPTYVIPLDEVVSDLSL